MVLLLFRIYYIKEADMVGRKDDNMLHEGIYMKKIKGFFTDPELRFRFLTNHGFCNWMNDKRWLDKMWFLKFNKKIDWNNPTTFNEKLQWLKLYDRKDIYTVMVDKYEVKKYVASIIGEEYIIPTLGLYDKFDDIDFDKLPKQFVIKCTHDSGGLVIVRDKSKMDKKAVRRKINKFLRRRYYYIHREWPYKNIKPRIIVEKYMEDKVAKELIDYKIMCFNGVPKILFTCTERFGDGLKVTFFDLNWNKLPFERHYPSSEKDIPKPKNFDKMIEFSKKLAEGMPFVRMDWYEINGKLYFGEYTFYPGSGFEEFTPQEWDRKLGDMINLNIGVEE